MDHSTINKILIRPVVTEKATHLKDNKKRNGEPLNQYVFEVAPKENKIRIRKAVESLYKVKVISVRTVNIEGKKMVRFTRAGRTEGRTRNWKKAIVTVAKDQTIEFVEGV